MCLSQRLFEACARSVPTTLLFCRPVAVDDALMGITHVVRAEEHLTNSLRQCLILDALEFPRPQYAHCSLILGEDRSKLSKRHGATSVDQFRQEVFIVYGPLEAEI